jgi:Putative DNA-binding domain
MSAIILAPESLDDPGVRREIGTTIASLDVDAAIERLRAYTGGYPARIEDALADSFPALRRVIGARTFAELRARYLPHVPDAIYNLNDVGSGFAAFLATDALTAQLPFAPDLARLEWAVQAAFHARERAPFDPSVLADWALEDWDEAVLELQPSVAVVASPWPIRDVWAARDTPIEEVDIQLEGRPDRVLVHRQGTKVNCESVSEEEALALEALRAGSTLGGIAQELAERGSDADLIGRWFAGWSRRGLIAACRRTRAI